MTAFDITTLVLSQGRHVSQEKGVCFLEAVSLLAGEVFSDYPRCVCQVIAEYGRALNDNMPDDATRTRLLLPYAERLLGTRAPANVRKKRAFLLADWAVRVIAPQALESFFGREEAACLHEQAIKLRNLAPVVDSKTASNARKYAKAAAKAASRLATHFSANAAADVACAAYAGNTAKAAGYAAHAARYAHTAAVEAAYATAAATAADEDAWAQADAAAADADVWTQAAAMLGSLCEVT